MLGALEGPHHLHVAMPEGRVASLRQPLACQALTFLRLWATVAAAVVPVETRSGHATSRANRLPMLVVLKDVAERLLGRLPQEKPG